MAEEGDKKKGKAIGTVTGDNAQETEHRKRAEKSQNCH